MKNTKINKPLKTQEDYDNYFKLAEWCNINDYEIKDDALDYYYADIRSMPTKFDISINEIADIEFRLDNDYRKNKYLDGEYTDEEWKVIAAERRKWRERLRELKGDVQL